MFKSEPVDYNRYFAADGCFLSPGSFFVPLSATAATAAAAAIAGTPPGPQGEEDGRADDSERQPAGGVHHAHPSSAPASLTT